MKNFIRKYKICYSTLPFLLLLVDSFMTVLYTIITGNKISSSIFFIYGYFEYLLIIIYILTINTRRLCNIIKVSWYVYLISLTVNFLGHLHRDYYFNINTFFDEKLVVDKCIYTFSFIIIFGYWFCYKLIKLLKT